MYAGAFFAGVALWAAVLADGSKFHGRFFPEMV